MKFIKSSKAIMVIPLFIIIAVIAGCKSEPSQDDVDKAVTKMIEDSVQQMQGMGGGLISTKAMTPTVNSVKKLSCAEEQDGNAYDCRVQTDVTTGIAGRQKTVINLQMMKVDDAWQVTKILP
ncbi:hypothetical protein AE372_003611 [Salmonella enterica subsp. enterica serovar Colindale]|nr:hypothetical protein [Salmonella enterica subsp. enterica serovar Colindale]